MEEKFLKALELVRVDKGCINIGGGELTRFVVRTPKCYLYDDDKKTQIQESLPYALDLKTYAIKHFPSPTPPSLKSQCHQLGRSLAHYIHSFHRLTERQVGGWRRSGSEASAKPALYAELERHKDMQELKHTINYDWLLQRVDMFPDILGDVKDTLEKVKRAAQDDLASDLLPIHGDFWTGK